MVSYLTGRKEKIIEFKKTEPYIAVNLIAKISEKKDEHLKLLMELKETTRKVIDMIDKLGYSSKIVGISFDRDMFREYSEKPLGGIDGSFQIVGGRGNTYYVMLTAVIVKLRKGIYSRENEIKIHYPENGIDVVSFNDPTYGEKTSEIAEDIMMYYETSALLNLVNNCKEGECYNSFIDGPIVDPPRDPTEQGSRILNERYNITDYFEFRSKPFIEAFNYIDHTFLTGYVKVPRNDRLLKDAFTKMGIDNELLKKYSGDSELAKMILTELIFEASAPKNIEIYGYIGPFKAEGGIYQKYMENDLAIYYIYGMNRPRTGVFRLEIGFPRDFSDDRFIDKIFEYAYRVAISSTLPGNRHPLPVALAHRKCHISKGAAEVIYEMILSNLIKDTLSKTSNHVEMRKYINMFQEEELKY